MNVQETQTAFNLRETRCGDSGTTKPDSGHVPGRT